MPGGGQKRNELSFVCAAPMVPAACKLTHASLHCCAAVQLVFVLLKALPAVLGIPRIGYVATDS
jgi:hypothetical protein